MPLNPIVRSLAAIYGSTMLAAAWAMMIPTIPVLVTQFDVSAGMAAQIVTAFGIGRFIGTAASGVILDHMGTRVATVGGSLASCVAALLAAGAPWLGLILALALLMGAGDSLWASGREMAGIDLARQSQRGRVISSIHGVHNLGLAIAPLIGGVLTEALGFRAAFVAYGLCAAAAVLLGFYIPETPVAPAPRTERAAGARRRIGSLLQWVRGLRDLFRQIPPDLRTTYIVLVLATIAAQSQRVTVQSMLPLYAGHYLDFTPTQLGLLFSISGVFLFVMILPAGFVIDKVGRKWATVPSTGIPAAVFLLIPFTESFLQLAILISLTGLSNGLSLGSIATSTYDVVPASARGRLQAIRRTLAEIGGVCAPLLGGYLADTFNPGVPFLVYAPLLVLSAALLAVFGRETLER